MAHLQPNTCGSEIRSTHPYAFRSGEWGEITGVVKFYGRDCYRIRWPRRERRPDMETIDYWPVEDPSDTGREFRVMPPDSGPKLVNERYLKAVYGEGYRWWFERDTLAHHICFVVWRVVSVYFIREGSHVRFSGSVR